MAFVDIEYGKYGRAKQRNNWSRTLVHGPLPETTVNRLKPWRSKLRQNRKKIHRTLSSDLGTVIGAIGVGAGFPLSLVS